MKSEVKYNDFTFVPYITNQQIKARIHQLGQQITADFRDKNPLFICVLNGAFPFASDLFREVDTDGEIAFIRLKSYSGTQSTGQVKEIVGLTDDIEGRNVIVVEDIIDTGHTIHRLTKDLLARNPADLKVATLLFKPEALERPVDPDYVGFNIPKKFIIGFGLDIDGKARNLNDIYMLKDEE